MCHDRETFENTTGFPVTRGLSADTKIPLPFVTRPGHVILGMAHDRPPSSRDEVFSSRPIRMLRTEPHREELKRTWEAREVKRS